MRQTITTTFNGSNQARIIQMDLSVSILSQKKETEKRSSRQHHHMP